MRAIVTVVGPDRVGIIAEVCTLLAGLNINIVDISQTVMATTDFDGIADALARKGKEMGLSIRVQREDIFNAMHTI